MKKTLSQKVALVTGAASGIGKAIASLYAQNGIRVALSDLNETQGRETAESLSKETETDTIFIRADVSNPEQCRNLIQETVASFGSLDIACNNAGIGGEINPTADYTLEGWRKVIAINLDSVFYCMKYEISEMQKKGGSIVNMASILGQVAFANSSAYVAAKHGVVGLTKTAAIEYAAQNVRINAVGPGFIDTPLLNQLPPEAKQSLVGLHPIGRLGRAEEVAELVLWLSSDQASFVTGAYYAIDGGYLAR